MGVTVYFRKSLSDPEEMGTSQSWLPDHDLKEASVAAMVTFIIMFIVMSVVVYKESRKHDKV